MSDLAPRTGWPATDYLKYGVVPGAVIGALYGAVLHPGPQYETISLGDFMLRTTAYGAITGVAIVGLTALGLRMGAIPTA